MIRVVIYDQPYKGLWSYRIDGHWGPGGAPLIGLAEHPDQEACRILRAMGVSVNTKIEFVDKMRRLTATATIRQGLEPPRSVKGLPAPIRRSRKGLRITGSGVPGDF